LASGEASIYYSTSNLTSAFILMLPDFFPTKYTPNLKKCRVPFAAQTQADIGLMPDRKNLIGATHLLREKGQRVLKFFTMEKGRL